MDKNILDFIASKESINNMPIYKGYEYTFILEFTNEKYWQIVKFPNKKFHTMEELERYVDKFLSREKKLLRLKMI